MSAPRLISGLVGLLLAFGMAATAQTSATAAEFWPQASASTRLGRTSTLLAYTELHDGEDFPYSQWKVGAQLGYQLKPIQNRLLLDIDSDRNHHLAAAAWYEYLATTQSGTSSHENRLGIDVTAAGYKLSRDLLARDRNRVEFRWKNGEYSWRYRNLLRVDADLRAADFSFTVYASGEVFYDSAHQSWDETRFTIGLQKSYRRILKVDTYYLRQDCSTCNPNPINAWGLNLNFFFRTPS